LKAKRAAPLDAARIDALLEPLKSARATLIAVSGGPDSTALLVMAADWARRHDARVLAATVDHGLRPESAAEAAGVARLAARLGVPHATLVWSGEKPETRLMEQAREARYRLLAAHAKEVGADAIATAHHLDDQAETVLFRLLRGSGVAGLAGMAPATNLSGITLVRPLLSLVKAELVGFCREHRVAFVEDPTNADPAYARTRLKALVSALAEEGLDSEGFARLARRMSQADAALDAMADALEARLGTDPNDANALFAAPVAVVHRVLARRIAAIGGRDASRIGLEKIEALAEGLAGAASEGETFGANVGGALVRLDGRGRLHVLPEPPRGARAGPETD
jgi:tRNA(Ile)-lysidine synthase